LCLRNLRKSVDPGGVLFASFFEGESKGNPRLSHSHAIFFYSKDEMDAMARRCGWYAY
jgi:hypothetical protein